MRKIFLFMMVSLDGFFEGPGRDLSWHNVDEEFNEYAIAQTKNVGALLFGRRTYELMRDYWPSEEARKSDPIVAKQMNETPKVVVSKSMDKVEETEHWKNIRLIRENVTQEVRKLKSEPRRDIAIYGSNNLCVNLMKENLVDEFRIMVNPVAIGKGTPLFAGLDRTQKFTRVDTKSFQNGNVLLIYQPL